MNEEKKYNAPDDRKIGPLIRNIRRLYRRFNRKKLISRFLLSLAGFLLVFCLLIWIEQQQYFSTALKTLFWAAGLALAILLFIAARQIFSTDTDSFTSFYSKVSNAIGLPPLRHAFDLALYSRDTDLKLYSTALNRNIREISWEELQPAIKTYLKDLPATGMFRLSLGVVAVSLGLFIASGLIYSEALVRSARFWDQYQKPNPYSFTLHPGNTTIEQGTAFRPEISFEGAVPEELLLGIKTEVEEQFRFRPLRETGTGTATFTSEPVNLSTNATYFVRMDAFRSPQYRVKVQLRPRFESLTAILFPPDYTGLDSTRFTYPFSQIKAYRGSRLRLAGQTNKPVSRLHLLSLVSGDTLSPASADSTRFTFRRNVTDPDTLQFEMKDPSGLTNNNTFKFTVEPVRDEYPFVQIQDPEGNVQMSTPSPLELAYEVSDDFGITSATLHYELNRAFKKEPETGSIDLGTPPMNATQNYRWDLTVLNPKPRDVITFWLEVTDNDGYSGYKRSSSRKLTVTLPSLVENMDEIGEQESEMQETLENISESYDEMRKEYERFKENLKENPETNWEQKQMLDEVRQKQEEIDKQVEDLNRKFEEIRKEINRNDMVSEDTRKAYEELQKIIDEINDPDLKKALEELQKAMGNLNQQQLREALKEFEFNEEVYRERLQRTIELFKALKLNSDLEKIATALEDLARKEGELSESDSPPSNRAEQQDAIREDTENLSEHVEQLNENAPEKAGENVRKLQEESRQSLESIRKQLQENIERLRQQQNSGNQNNDGNDGDNQQSPSPRQQQQQIQQQFQRLAQKMRQAKQQFSQQRMRINMAALQNILYNLVILSEEQEELTRSTEHLANRSQAFVDKARIEKNISRHFSRVADSLFAVSSQIPSFSNKINPKKKEVERNLEQAVEQMAERNKSQSTYAGRQSLGGINDLASMVASLMDQLQNQQQNGMAGGMSMQQFMEQLQQMSGDQQKLNRQIQNLINDIQGDRLTRDQIERLNQMARQQNQIRRQLRELQQNGGLESGDRLLSELERMAREMEETINDLRGGETDRMLIERQQNILSRMLNAEKAIQERNKEERREGTAAEDPPRAVPPDVTLEELQKKIRNLLNDPELTQFSEDYQKLIEQYFELLKKLREKEVSS